MYRAPTPVSCVVYVALCWCISVFPLYFYICPSLCPLSLVSGSPFSEQVKNEGKGERGHHGGNRQKDEQLGK